MRVCFLLLCFGALSAAQTVEGEAYDFLTGAPLAGAYASISNSLSPGVSKTDVAGHFQLTFPATTTGTTTLTFLVIARPGYLLKNQPVALKPNQNISSLRVALTPAAVISGKLVDEDGFPVHGQVQALSYRVEHGERQLLPSGSAALNDRGEYRLTGLVAGSYYVGVVPGNTRNWDPRYVSQYVGGGLKPDDKNMVEVKAGQERSGVDGTLKKYEGVSISGRVAAPEGTPSRQMPVELRVRDKGLRDFFSAVTERDGSFAIRHVPPGSYTLYSQAGELRAGDLLADSSLEVETSDVTGLVLALRAVQAVDVAGTLVRQGGGSPQPMLIQLNSQLGKSVRSNEDGTFVLKGLLPGHYTLQVLPDFRTARGKAELMSLVASAAFPSSARLGDKEVLQTGFDLDGTPAGPLQITLKPQIPITGRVVDAAGNPVAGAVVEAISGEDYQGGGMTDKDGVFRMALKSAGKYRIYATTDQTAMMEPDYFKGREKDYTPVRIVEGQNPPILVRLAAK